MTILWTARGAAYYRAVPNIAEHLSKGDPMENGTDRLINACLAAIAFVALALLIMLGGSAWVFKAVPPEQVNYSQSWLGTVTERPVGFPGVQEAK